MSEVIRPEGWQQWNKTDISITARYAEWHSTGPGGSPNGRVPWSKQLTDDEARTITVKRVLGGWNPTVPAPRTSSQSMR